MADTFNLIFFPTVKVPAKEEKVKSNLVATLKVDAEKVDAWFSAGKPTLLLKNVVHDVADRYMQAIIKCGADCSVQPSTESPAGLSLIAGSNEKTELFVCPSCTYKERVPRGKYLGKCPECDYVVRPLTAEDKNDAIRRRTSRDARLEEQRQEDELNKHEELEQLRKLERKLMLDLGIKPPGRFWVFYSSYPVLFSGAVVLLLIGASVAISLFANQFVGAGRKQALLAREPSAHIQSVAPVMAAAVNMMQSGHQALVQELAMTNQLLQAEPANPKQIIEAAEQMMKGANPESFLNATKNTRPRIRLTPGGSDEPQPSPVNLDTLGGVTGITGVVYFSERQLASMSPDVTRNGLDNIVRLLGERSANPGPGDNRGQLEVLDGSALASIMSSLTSDYEWDLYLLGFVREYLDAGLIQRASKLSDDIGNPLIKIAALGDVMAERVMLDQDADLGPAFVTMQAEIERLSDPDSIARLRISLGENLGASGAAEEPFDSMDYLEKLIAGTTDPYRKSVLSARYAVARVSLNKRSARKYFNIATRSASQIFDTAQRLSAFTIIAQRYYDARNLTLANAILTEVQILASTQLKIRQRSLVFAEIAHAQLYVGDLSGALISIENAAVGSGREQLKGRLVEFLISVGKIHMARDLLTRITDVVEYNRLLLRLISYLMHADDLTGTNALLERSKLRVQDISELALKAMVLSQYGRIYVRLNQKALADKYFTQAITLSNGLTGRKAAVAKGMVAYNQARALMIKQGTRTLAGVNDSSIKEPIASEIASMDRIIKNLLPESVGLASRDR